MKLIAHDFRGSRLLGCRFLCSCLGLMGQDRLRVVGSSRRKDPKVRGYDSMPPKGTPAPPLSPI